MSASTVLVRRCPDKKCFASHADAEAWERENRGKHGNPTQQYPYQCEDCSAFHLSGFPPAIREEIKNRPDIARPKRQHGAARALVAQLRATGMDVKQIAKQLVMTPQAVKYHLSILSERPVKAPSPSLGSIQIQKRHLEEQLRLSQAKLKALEEQEQEVIEQNRLRLSWLDDAVLVRRGDDRLRLTIHDIGTLEEFVGDSEGW